MVPAEVEEVAVESPFAMVGSSGLSRVLGWLSLGCCTVSVTRRNPQIGAVGVALGIGAAISWRVDVFRARRRRFLHLHRISSLTKWEPVEILSATDDRPTAEEEDGTAQPYSTRSSFRSGKLGRRRVRDVLAAAFSLVAYFQFGPRTRSQANYLVTRKYLRDYMREHKPADLRFVDMGPIIDVAVHLSFYPTAEHLDTLDMLESGFSNVCLGGGGGTTRVERLEYCRANDGLLALIVECLTPGPRPGVGI